jgi:hypothetical protein
MCLSGLVAGQGAMAALSFVGFYSAPTSFAMLEFQPPKAWRKYAREKK